MKLYYLPRTAIEAEIHFQALYVRVQRLKTSLTKCQTRYCIEPRPSVDDCRIVRFWERFIKPVHPCTSLIARFAQQNALLLRTTDVRVGTEKKAPREQNSSSKKIGAVWCRGAGRHSFEASAVPFEKRHAGCEEREKINRRRIYDTLRINFFEATKQTACIFSKGEATGVNYYGARYLDPKYSRWLSGDPALSDYIPKAPIDDEAKKHNENLPGMGGVFNVVNLYLYHYAGNNPVKYTDPDGKASILQRPINKVANRAYNIANFFGTNLGVFLHGLVDYGDLSSVSDVAQYSGEKSGITSTDTSSIERDYKIIYTGMDDDLTKQAVEIVNNMERFGAGNKDGKEEGNTTNAGAKYKIFLNDCNDYTAAVFKEYKSLWKEKYKQDNPKSWKIHANLAWLAHWWKISGRKGEWIKIEN